MRLRTTSLLALPAVLLAARVASAQSTGFALDRFDPSERGSEWFALDSLDLRGNGRLALGVVGDWGHKPLVIYDGSGNERSVLVRDQLFVHVGGAVNVADRLRLAANVPVLAYKSGDAGSVNGTALDAPSGQPIGDVRLSADARLVGEYRTPLEVALGLSAFLPTGSQDAYAGDGKVRLVPHLLAAGEVAQLVYAVRVGFEWRDPHDPLGTGTTGSELQLGAAAGLRAADGKLVLGPEIYGSSVVSNGNFFSKTATPFELIAGAHYQAARDWRVGAGVGPGLTRGYGSPELRVVASLEWAPAVEEPLPPPSDRDRDGVLDADDACPDTPGVRTDDPKTNGCPPPADRDKDGVLDKDDACPDTPGVKTDDPKTNGCPPPADRDKDGVLDKDDACPDEAGVKTDDPKTNGCPPPPPDPDRDKDGIKNEADACPDEAGVADPDPKKNGCPKAAVKNGQIVILEQVKFKTGSAKILPASDSILQAVKKVLDDHTEIQRVRVEGHTDNRGGAAMNKKLSTDRAASVVKWLVSHGIDKKRLVSQGFGQDRPIDTNATDAGRQNNRRVEFHIEPEAK
jgi:OOP family OmpA-OmpF porin